MPPARRPMKPLPPKTSTRGRHAEPGDATAGRHHDLFRAEPRTPRRPIVSAAATTSAANRGANPSVRSAVADQVIKLGHAGGDARAVRVAVAGQLQFRQHVPADVRSGLRGKADPSPPHAHEHDRTRSNTA